MKKKEFDLELLSKMWCEQNLTLEQIGKQLHASPKTVHKAIRDNELIRNYQNESWLRYHHSELKMNCKQMASLANCNVDTIYSYMEKHQIQVNSEVTHLIKIKHSQDDSFFKDIDTEEKAYWLGFIMADGCITDHNGMELTIVSARRDHHHLQRFLQAISSTRELDEYATTLKSTGKIYPMSRAIVRSRKMCEDLMHHGVLPRKSGNEVFPKLDPHLQKAFALGYIDGDGGITCGYRTRRNALYLTLSIVGGYSVLKAISDLIAEQIGIKVSIREKGKIFTISFADGSAAKVLQWLYDDSVYFLDRKKNKFHEWLELKGMKI